MNIIGQGIRDGSKVWVMGECKSQLQKKHVKNFEKKLKRLEGLFPGEKVIVFVAYNTSPQVERYLKERGYKFYYSYELGKA